MFAITRILVALPCDNSTHNQSCATSITIKLQSAINTQITSNVTNLACGTAALFDHPACEIATNVSSLALQQWRTAVLWVSVTYMNGSSRPDQQVRLFANSTYDARAITFIPQGIVSLKSLAARTETVFPDTTTSVSPDLDTVGVALIANEAQASIPLANLPSIVDSYTAVELAGTNAVFNSSRQLLIRAGNMTLSSSYITIEQVAGICAMCALKPTRTVAVDVISFGNGTSFASSQAAALNWVESLLSFPRGVSVWSIFFGFSESTSPTAALMMGGKVSLLSYSGITLVASVGTDGANDVYYPATFPEAIAVGTTVLRGEPLGVLDTPMSARFGQRFTTGGGFSSLFEAASIQRRFQVPSSRFRGVPDLVAPGIAFIPGVADPVLSPFVAVVLVSSAVVSASDRLVREHGGLTLSLAQRALYHLRPIARDITDGTDNCPGSLNYAPFLQVSRISTNCFSAVEGWDAITGRGVLRAHGLIYAAIDSANNRTQSTSFNISRSVSPRYSVSRSITSEVSATSTLLTVLLPPRSGAASDASPSSVLPWALPVGLVGGLALIGGAVAVIRAVIAKRPSPIAVDRHEDVALGAIANMNKTTPGDVFEGDSILRPSPRKHPSELLREPSDFFL